MMIQYSVVFLLINVGVIISTVLNKLKKKILIIMVGFVVESRGYSDSSIIINQTLRTKFVLSL